MPQEPNSCSADVVAVWAGGAKPDGHPPESLVVKIWQVNYIKCNYIHPSKANCICKIHGCLYSPTSLNKNL